MIKRYWVVLFALASPLFFIARLSLASPENEKKVYVIPIEDRKVFSIDLGLSAFVKRAVKEAEEAKASAIIFPINTFGGRVDAATQIRDTLFNTSIKTIAFVNKRAISAGSLIALACQSIIMTPGATIGAAMPVKISPGGGEKALGEKYVSFLRNEFKSTAERNNYPAELAEAMVDADVELKAVTIDNRLIILTPGELKEKIKELGAGKIKVEKNDIPLGFSKGKLLTLTTDEALRFGLASRKINKIEDILPLYNLKGATLVNVPITWSENLVRFLTKPMISGLLLSLGALGLIFEMWTPGWGVGGTIGVFFLALFFGGQYLVGMASWIEPVLFVSGIGLLLVEIFVIPGFGIAGIGGIILIVASLFLTLVRHPFSTSPIAKEEYRQALYTISLSFIAVFVIILLSLKFIPRTRFWKRLRPRIVLTSREKPEEGYQSTSPTWERFLGKEGKSLSILRPAGRAVFGEEILDVVTEGSFINRGRRVKIIKVEGNRIIVAESGKES
ncbi:MAG: nodulation protein NfeD [Nitrospirae bacterium]|nr:nodulation protein NfeD [Nitrospirota bacterium]